MGDVDTGDQSEVSVLRRSILWAMMMLVGRRQRGGGAKKDSFGEAKATPGERYWPREQSIKIGL